MKRFVPALLCFAVTATTALAAGGPLSVAVFDFQSSDDTPRDLGPKISALVFAELATDT
jgi:hypothetical protein